MALEMEATKADLVNGDTQIAKADALIEEARQVAEQLQQARDEVQVCGVPTMVNSCSSAALA